MKTVVVVIASFRRPDRLRTALDSLVAAAGHAPDDWRVGVTVVDDDPEGSAAAVVSAYRDAFGAGCNYVVSAARNISIARNTGLESALAHATYVASIDDDVVVPQQWFETCARAVAGSAHNAVTGPLIKDFSAGPGWLSREPFDRMGLLAGVDGEDAFVCATGNNWMSGDFLRANPDLRFSVDLGETGGEDMDFFYRSVERGLRPVYSVAAAVTEVEPPGRCTLRYQLRRAYWLGVSEAQIGLRLRLFSRLRLFARAGRRAANRGAALIPADRHADRGARWSLAVLAQCVGMVLGGFGVKLRHK